MKNTVNTESFNSIIGYNHIKGELFTILDMMAVPEKYEKLGASVTKGILLVGDPGTGKSSIAKAFGEAWGRYSIFRKTRSNGDFCEELKKAFEEAAEMSKDGYYVLILDDMDKFSEGDSDAPEEFSILQGLIDQYRHCKLQVIATVNDYYVLPDSLERAGRFDIKFNVKLPSGADHEAIIRYYLSGKPVDEAAYTDVCKLFHHQTCADLQNLINNAAIYAAKRNAPLITIEDFVSVIIKERIGSNGEVGFLSDDEKSETAWHEAAHVVCAEVLHLESVSYATIMPARFGESSHVAYCKMFNRRPVDAIVSLAGGVGVELKLGVKASGRDSDYRKAANIIREGIARNGNGGVGLMDVSNNLTEPSQEQLRSTEIAILKDINEFEYLARKILIKNNEFFEKVYEALCEKETLVFSDIQTIKRCSTIIPIEVH